MPRCASGVMLDDAIDDDESAPHTARSHLAQRGHTRNSSAADIDITLSPLLAVGTASVVPIAPNSLPDIGLMRADYDSDTFYVSPAVPLPVPHAGFVSMTEVLSDGESAPQTPGAPSPVAPVERPPPVTVRPELLLRLCFLSFSILLSRFYHLSSGSCGSLTHAPVAGAFFTCAVRQAIAGLSPSSRYGCAGVAR